LGPHCIGYVIMSPWSPLLLHHSASWFCTSAAAHPSKMAPFLQTFVKDGRVARHF